MSNSAVGQTYESIIEETVRASQQDFIEAGISLDYLEALRTIWQSKLTNSKVASFPWARAPSPPPAPAVQHDTSPTPNSSDQQTQLPQQQPAHYHNRAMAALRAMQQVQQHAATQPEASNGATLVVNQLAAIAQEQNERFQQEQELRKLKEEEEQRLRIEVKGEDDLFGDDDLEYNSSYAGSKRDISQVDSPEEAMRPAPSFMDGPLVSNTPPADADSDIDAPHDPVSPPHQFLDPSHLITPQSTQKKVKKEIDPLDDAINSDLDDSDIESDLDSEFGEGEEGDDGVTDKSIVLCMYEKVHRTKNKWKCQLKDGVISIGGKDWVFNRANGEFEW